MPTQEWFISNVPFEATKADIITFLEQAPGVTVGRVRMITKKDTGEFRGFAFAQVLFRGDDPEAVIATIFGKRIGDREIIIEPANDRPQHLREQAATQPA